MEFPQHKLAIGLVAVMLGLAGLPVGIAQAQLPSDAAPVTPNNVPYPNAADPDTGQIVANTGGPKTVPGMTGARFLTFGGGEPRLDTPISACSYYYAIGAVQSCGQNGELVNPITFDQWKQFVKIDKYAINGKKTDVAHFINLVDLNLTRDHHLISYGPSQLAGYVCNHAGPQPTAADPTGLFPTQQEVDALIADIRNKKNVVACVAMEYSAQVEYKGTLQPGNPFTKFWIFGPQGALMSTVDLDGRGPKGVPHVCTACHGGDFAYETANPPYEFNPNNGPESGNLNAHFLPFDMANFAFSSKLSPAEQELAIFKMNLDVYTTENALWITDPSTGQPAAGTLAAASIAQLIQGWYGNMSPQNTTPQFNRTFVPSAWNSDPTSRDVYLNVVAHNCRTCHIAMERQPFELGPNRLAGFAGGVLCSAYTMPNSQVTFDRFWLSQRGGSLNAQQSMFLTGTSSCNAP